MRGRIVIADASPLIALSDIGELALLYELFGEIFVTDIVRNEIHADLPPWIQVSQDYDDQQKALLALELDEGEASAIAMALKYQDSRLLLDEKRGRGVAKRLGVSVIGTIGVIIMAKQKGIISSGKQILDKLDQHGFWISNELKTKVLALLNEAS
ncbi:MAG: DUF3368 domain-containing protein [Bacteroidota bacterium]